MRKIIISIMLIVVFILQASTVFALEPDTADAIKFTKAPSIDGTISEAEWGAASKVDISNCNPANAYLQEGGAITSYSVWLRYDATNFYMAVQVADEKLVNTNSGGEMWDGDCVQFEVDPLGNWQSQGKSDMYYVSDNAREFIFSYNTYDFVTYSWCYTKNEEPEGEFAVANRDGKTTYEAAIPWSYFDVEAPGADDVIGLTIAVITASDYSYDGWLEWGSGCIVEERDEAYKSGNNKIVLTATEFSPDETYPTTGPTKAPEKPQEVDKLSKYLMYIIAGVVVGIIVIVAVVILLIKSKKKK